MQNAESLHPNVPSRQAALECKDCHAGDAVEVTGIVRADRIARPKLDLSSRCHAGMSLGRLQ